MTRTLAILALALFAAGCDDEPRQKKKKPATPVAQASAAPTSPQAPATPPEPAVQVVLASKTAPAIRITGIRSDKPQSSSEKALHDAIQMAQVEIMRALQKLDPPVMAKPSLAKIRNEFVKRDTIREIHPTTEMREKWKKEGVDANRMWVEIDVVLSESQLQQLRASDRVGDGVRGAGVLFAIVLAAYGFLRVDAWSKGYLTTWLAIAAVVIAVLAAIALWAGRNVVSFSP